MAIFIRNELNGLLLGWPLWRLVFQAFQLLPRRSTASRVLAVGALAYPHLEIFVFNTQIAGLFRQLRNLLLVGVTPVLGGNDLLCELTYLVCLIVGDLVELGYALRVVFLYVEIAVKRLLLMIYHHVQTLDLSLIRVMLCAFALGDVLAFTARQDKMKDDVTDEAKAEQAKY